jgi:hypothetical protein
MTEPDPEFDAVHPSGHILFRSCRGGYLHSVTLAEAVMDTDAQTLARTQATLGVAEAGALVEQALAGIAQGLVGRGTQRLVVVQWQKDGWYELRVDVERR